jgi:hypothetical protein
VGSELYPSSELETEILPPARALGRLEERLDLPQRELGLRIGQPADAGGFEQRVAVDPRRFEEFDELREISGREPR